MTVLLLAAVPVGPAAALVPDQDACSDTSLPYVLNVGLPRLPDVSASQVEALKRDVLELIGDFYAEHGRCPQRQLQVNVTVATDYEILDWLGQELLDAAVVPDLVLYLLQERDGVDLREMDIAGHPVGSLVLPVLRPQVHSARLMGGQWERRPDPAADFAAFKDQIWQRARRPPQPGEAPAGPPAYRIVLASHLSTPGFLAPLAEVASWLDGRLRSAAAGAGEEQQIRERFWQAFFEDARFAVDCDSLERNPAPGTRSCWQLPAAEERARSGPVEILFPGESVLRRPISGPAGESAPGRMQRSREHLVIAARAAEPLFDSGLTTPQVVLPPAVAPLFAAEPPLAAFAPLLAPEPSFGVRAFRFTADEAFRLLRQDQAAPGTGGLALVLPGGGVKAAYQSTVVDALYSEGYLKNFRATSAPGPEPLDVHYVIGTSGGALLGFFVSQLREKGPWKLAEILWTRDDGEVVESTDIFAWTDLLRYVSVVVSFLVLCALLALVSIPERSRWSPDSQPSAAQRLLPGDRHDARGLRRPGLLGVLLPVLLLAPILVRKVSGEALQEHVPQFEGLVYAVLAMIAMVADQALMKSEKERPPGEPWLHPALPLAAGLGLVALPLLPGCPAWCRSRLEQPVTFLWAFAVLAPLVLLGALILPLRAGRAHGRPGWLWPAVHFLVPAGSILALGLVLPPSWLNRINLPFFLAGLLLVLVCIAANLFLGPRPLLTRGPRLGERPRRALYYLALALSASLLLLLCWPEQADPSRPGETLQAPTLDVTLGTFLLCVGLLLLMLGGLARVYVRQRKYHLQLLEFLQAYGVALLHGVAVYAVLFAVIKLLPDWLTPLELTGQFWGWLLATSAVLGTVLIFVGRSGLGERTRLGRLVRSGCRFLCSHHPNGNVVTRRFLRIALFSVACLGWWNLVVAPALYSNHLAFRYLQGAARRFEAEVEGADAPKAGLRYRPTARFIAPANLLEKDGGTRYFLFVPEGDDCPATPRRSVGGSQWLSFEARLVRPGEPEKLVCGPLRDEKFLHDVIFASGSPFPIFPAHLLPLERRDEKRSPLVDGGYSNNVPVDVALRVAAGQVLIVDSTNPLGHVSSASWLSRGAAALLVVRGKLVENLGRLPGFLFERSQQVDRLSRRDLFVVSLAPSREEPDWPPLFDFRRSTVTRLIQVAERDLGRRIGFVESWGRPRFPLSVPVEGKREAPRPAPARPAR